MSVIKGYFKKKREYLFEVVNTFYIAQCAYQGIRPYLYIRYFHIYLTPKGGTERSSLTFYLSTCNYLSIYLSILRCVCFICDIKQSSYRVNKLIKKTLSNKENKISLFKVKKKEIEWTAIVFQWLFKLTILEPAERPSLTRIITYRLCCSLVENITWGCRYLYVKKVTVISSLSFFIGSVYFGMY